MFQIIVQKVTEAGSRMLKKGGEILAKESVKRGAMIAGRIASYVIVIALTSILVSNYKDRVFKSFLKKHDKEMSTKLSTEFQNEINRLKSEIADLKLKKKESIEKFKAGVENICKKYGIDPNEVLTNAKKTAPLTSVESTTATNYTETSSQPVIPDNASTNNQPEGMSKKTMWTVIGVLGGALLIFSAIFLFSSYGSITFADPAVKKICISKWDTNGDGELSKKEAASVTDLEDAFCYNDEITSFDELKYFTGLTRIQDSAFSGCSGLTSIEIPNSVTSFEKYAFSSCSGLTSIKIPNSVTNIGSYAFLYCSGLTSIEIPKSVTSIGEDAFPDNCEVIRK